MSVSIIELHVLSGIESYAQHRGNITWHFSILRTSFNPKKKPSISMDAKNLIESIRIWLKFVRDEGMKLLTRLFATLTLTIDALDELYCTAITFYVVGNSANRVSKICGIVLPAICKLLLPNRRPILNILRLMYFFNFLTCFCAY